MFKKQVRKAKTNAQLAKEIKGIRLSIGPVINQQFEYLLLEIEERLSGKMSESKAKAKKSSSRPTKQEIYSKYFNS
jgi:type II secretory pathway component GspD/PulD (secretin)